MRNLVESLCEGGSDGCLLKYKFTHDNPRCPGAYSDVGNEYQDQGQPLVCNDLEKPLIVSLKSAAQIF